MFFYLISPTISGLLRLAMREAPATSGGAFCAACSCGPDRPASFTPSALPRRHPVPGTAQVEVRTPVFIVGHARSGTTLRHRLMSEDHERFQFIHDV